MAQESEGWARVPSSMGLPPHWGKFSMQGEEVVFAVASGGWINLLSMQERARYICTNGVCSINWPVNQIESRVRNTLQKEVLLHREG